MIRIAIIGLTFITGLSYDIPGALILLGSFAIGSQDWLENLGKPPQQWNK